MVVPPIKCQGIKTKIVPTIQSLIQGQEINRWIEPFCGSYVVAFNCLPKEAILVDTNKHIIHFYQSLQRREITHREVRAYLESEGKCLAETGEGHYYKIRERFNKFHNPLDFLFLNRACFNGLIRFNRKGEFNTPFCRKPERFAPAYITKIVHQGEAIKSIVSQKNWKFVVSDFRDTISLAQSRDVIYADPPYLERHTDYYNAWSKEDEQGLTHLLKQTSAYFLLSTWQENVYRENEFLKNNWFSDEYQRISLTHFYHVGASEDLRHEMIEAIITNLPEGKLVSTTNSPEVPESRYKPMSQRQLELIL